MTSIKQLLTRKEQFVLRELNKSVNKLTKFMYSEGISQHDANTFFVQCVFQTSSPITLRKKKLSQQFSSETEEQTNSETSDRVCENLEIALEKVIATKLQSGKKLQQILLNYAEKCCQYEQKLRNYLLSEEQVSIRSVEFKKLTFDFQKIRERIQQKKYVSKMNHKESSIRYSLIDADEPSLTDDYSLGDPYETLTPRRRRVDETENELNYMHSFERSLAESIKKTKLLRNMLEKQLSSELSSLRFNDNDQQLGQQEEIY